MSDGRTALERKLLRVWQEVLEIDRISIEDDFHDLGGDSLAAVMMLTSVAEELGHVVPLDVFYQNPTLAHIRDYIGGRSTWSDALEEESASVHHARPLLAARIRPKGSKPPLFFVCPLGGLFPSTILVGILDLALALDADRPVYGLQPPAIAPNYFDLRVNVEDWRADEERLNGIIEECLSVIEPLAADGPYALAGYCSGAFLALELAAALERRGHPPGRLALIDPTIPTEIDATTNRAAWDHNMAWFVAKDLANNGLGLEVGELSERLLARPAEERWPYARALLREKSLIADRISAADLESLYRVGWVNDRVVLKLIADRPPPRWGGAISVLLSQGEPAPDPRSVGRIFGPPVAGRLSIGMLASDHAGVFQDARLGETAAALDAVLNEMPTDASRAP